MSAWMSLCWRGAALLSIIGGVATQAKAVDQLPIHIVYVNHVEVESVIDYVPPLVDGATYVTTPATYAFTSGQLEWEIAQAEAVGGYLSFHMSGAYAERAVAAGDQALWAQHLAGGHTVGIHFHSFLRGPNDFEWIPLSSPNQAQVDQAWQDNFDLVGALVGSEALWIGESHYGCPFCWSSLGFSLSTTEQMVSLPAGQHIVWLVERNGSGVVTYPHYPQIGQAGWHGPAGNQIYFDLRVGQLKKEFLMLYLEWLERERLGLAPQVWAWGWNNHGGSSTQQHSAVIQEMLTWLSADFAGRLSPRGNAIAQFVGDHEFKTIYESYEASGGQPLPSPLTNINDQFPYMADALTDAGVTADLSADLALADIRLFELERDPAENPLPSPLPRVYLLFRETDGAGVVDISGVLASQGVDATSLTLINVVNGSTSQVDPSALPLGSAPMVLEVDTGLALPLAYFAVHCEPTTANVGVWFGLLNMVAAAEERQIKLTIEFTPQWAEMILADPTMQAALLSWRASGHEVGGHHHPFTHPGGWDGYSNDPAVASDPSYRGDMADYMDLLNTLVAPDVVLTLGNPDDADWPVGVPYRTEGAATVDAVSAPTWEQPNGEDVWLLGYGALVAPPKTAELIALYPTATTEEVFGVVTHAFNYVDDPGMIEDWWDFLVTQDPTGSRNRTVTEILSGLPVPGDATDSPFGFHPAGVYTPGYPDNGFIDAQNIGITWSRQGVYAFWFIIQPDLNSSVYDFSMYDQQWSDVPQEINILANISPQGPIDEGRCLPGSWIPVDIPKYTAFVQATVERYDGDGIGEESFPGGVFTNPIKYWQVANEPNANTKSGFEDLQCMTYQAIKSVCPGCVVLNGGVAGLGMIGGQDYVTNFETAYEPILQGLAGQCVDVFDFHWYGNATGDYRFRNPSGGEDVLAYVRGRLATNGFPSELPIWITEMGTYSGDPPPVPYDPTADLPPQTERQQAGDYFKRFLYSLSRGVEKVFPAFGVIEGFVAGDRNYFDHTGLIYNGIGPQDPDYPDADPDDLGLGVRKLGYYTYKKMTEMLEGADWSTVTLLRDGTDTDWLYLIRVIKDGQPIHIAWWDYFDEPGYTPGDTKDIALTGLVGETATVTTVVPYAELGQDVTDYATAFELSSYTITGGSVTIPLGEDPVIVEAGGSLAVPAVSEWGMIVMALLTLTAGTIVISGPRRAIHGRTKKRSL